MLESANGWLHFANCQGMSSPFSSALNGFPPLPELFLCEAMHQLSLHMPYDDGRKAVACFRDKFEKQNVIASKVLGPLIRKYKLPDTHTDRHAATKVVESFARYGYVPAHVRVPLVLEIAARVACQVSMYAPSGSIWFTRWLCVICLLTPIDTCFASRISSPCTSCRSAQPKVLPWIAYHQARSSTLAWST
jgi:hypothetical protein